MMTLKQAILEYGEMDIADNIFDYGNCYCYDMESNDDTYNLVMDFMAEHIQFIEYKKNWFSICLITDFLEKYKKAFDEFLNDTYKEEYTPEYIKKKYNLDEITADDELFYEVYFDMFNSLLNGGFSGSDYEKLYIILTKTEKEIK